MAPLVTALNPFEPICIASKAPPLSLLTQKHGTAYCLGLSKNAD